MVIGPLQCRPGARFESAHITVAVGHLAHDTQQALQEPDRDGHALRLGVLSAIRLDLPSNEYLGALCDDLLDFGVIYGTRTTGMPQERPPLANRQAVQALQFDPDANETLPSAG